MDKEQVREFVRRWREVEALEEREVKEMSVEVKFRRLLAVQQLARGLGLSSTLAGEEATAEREVRLRWRRLRETISRGGSN